MKPASVGIIGLGQMGLPMARNLMEAGRDVKFVSSRIHEDLQRRGAEALSSPAELAEKCDIILLVVPGKPEIDAVLWAEDGVYSGAENPLVVTCSSVDPTDVTEIADRCRAASIVPRLVDAPLSGGIEAAQAGSLSIMVGGSEADYAAVKEVLTLCGDPTYMGPLGSGQVAKACNQIIVASTMIAIGEVAAIASRAGMDLERLFSVLSKGYAYSRVLESRAPKVIAEDYDALGKAKYMTRDLHTALAITQNLEITAAGLSASSAVFDDIAVRGFGDKDMCVTRQYVESLVPDRDENHEHGSQ